MKLFVATFLFVLTASLAHAGNCDNTGYNGALTWVAGDGTAVMQPGHLFSVTPARGWMLVSFGGNLYFEPPVDVYAMYDDDVCHVWLTMIDDGIFVDDFESLEQ